jgi:hypothetical protein
MNWNTTAGGPGHRFFVGCSETKEGSESAEVLAADIHRVVLDGMGLSPNLAADDSSIPEGKVANLTTDTASVMSKAADILSKNYRLFKNMAWTPCSCHVLNLFLVDQEKHFRSVRALLARGKLIISVFRNSAPRKVFQRCVPPLHLHGSMLSTVKVKLS